MQVSEIIAEVGQIIRRRLPDKKWKILLFGSQATGKAGVSSDIDVAIDGPRAVPNKTMMRIRNDIEAIPTLRSIDVVDLDSTSPRFRERVKKAAKMLD